jgi:cysteine-rich CWC protein
MSDGQCARCGTAFHCGVDDAQPCWCVAVPLGDAARAALASRYVGCLCASCLAKAGQADRIDAAIEPIDDTPR